MLDVLDHVLRKNRVEDTVGEGKRLAHVEEGETRRTPGLEVGVEPALQRDATCADMQLSRPRRLEIVRKRLTALAPPARLGEVEGGRRSRFGESPHNRHPPQRGLRRSHPTQTEGRRRAYRGAVHA